MIYNMPCFDQDSIFYEQNIISYAKIAYQEFKLKFYLRLRNRNYELQDKLITQIDNTNEMCLNILEELRDGFDSTIAELQSNEKYKDNLDELYVEGLTNIETRLDDLQMYLIKMKSVLDKKNFRYENYSKIDTVLQKTNRNLNLIIAIRGKIDILDDMTNNTRFFVETNKKHNVYSNILLVITIVNFVFAFIDNPNYPRLMALGVGLISLIGLVGFRHSKNRINSLYFKTHTINKDCGSA